MDSLHGFAWCPTSCALFRAPHGLGIGHWVATRAPSAWHGPLVIEPRRMETHHDEAAWFSCVCETTHTNLVVEKSCDTCVMKWVLTQSRPLVPQLNLCLPFHCLVRRGRSDIVCSRDHGLSRSWVRASGGSRPLVGFLSLSCLRLLPGTWPWPPGAADA